MVSAGWVRTTSWEKAASSLPKSMILSNHYKAGGGFEAVEMTCPPGAVDSALKMLAGGCPKQPLSGQLTADSWPGGKLPLTFLQYIP